MPKLRVLSGDRLIKAFEHNGFMIEYGKGSHVKLVRDWNGEKQTLVVPRHKTVAKGTLKTIYTLALQYLPEQDLRGIFYTN
jgi:predicted RNA binding protein YcfA (HicA-like mRNA interferase family)